MKMINWVVNYYNKSADVDTAQQTFAYWLEWQEKQTSAHFVDCALASYIPIKSGLNTIYMKYCFGLYSNLIYMPEHCEIFAYINSLITIYDACKGYVRTLKGDPIGIVLMRKVITDRKVDALYVHDFQCYNYNYKVLHGHTVGYHSLSTLFMFFLSNYMYYYSSCNDYFPYIDIDACKDVYNNKHFGDICYINQVKKTTSSINIKLPEKKEKSIAYNSWPSVMNNANTSKCESCERVCENFWGKKRHCLDCHLYKVCKECGGQVFTKDKSGYPVCVIHMNL